MAGPADAAGRRLSREQVLRLLPVRARMARTGTWLALALAASITMGAAGCGGTSGPRARVVSENAVDARTVDLAIDSPALETTVGVRLLLPPDWSSQPDRRWPVLYLLHGARAVENGDPPNYQEWTYHTDVEALTADTDVLVVMPEGGNVGWYSDWYNGGEGGPPAWETFHLVELPRILKSRYRAGSRWAIAGLSMGGFGAASYAARHPGMFQAVASYSGDLYTTKYWFITTGSLWLQGFDPAALWGPGDPAGSDYRADLWQAHDPYHLAEDLVGTPVFVSAGDGTAGPFDPPGTQTDTLEQGALDAAQSFSTRLAQLGGSITTDFYGPGTHSWPYWQQELHRSFPMLMSAIGAM